MVFSYVMKHFEISSALLSIFSFLGGMGSFLLKVSFTILLHFLCFILKLFGSTFVLLSLTFDKPKYLISFLSRALSEGSVNNRR